MSQNGLSGERDGARFARRIFIAGVAIGAVAGGIAWVLWGQNPDGLSRQLQRMPSLLAAHVRLTILALFVATIVSVPLGVAATRSDTLRHVAVGSAGVIQTIPGLALLAIMVPLLSGVGLPGIGFLPAFLGLTLYCVLPILMGTVTGLTEVDAAMIEAARGVGMTPASSSA